MDATTTLADLGVNPHPGYADQLAEITTPREAIDTARELVAHLEALAALESRPRTNATALLFRHAEAGEAAEQIRAFLLTFEVPA